MNTNTTYYVRAYATSSGGTSYGEEVQFTTLFECGTSMIKDVDGNAYNTVLIGDQCWMRDNLRTTKYSDGTSISLGVDTSVSIAYRYAPNNSEDNVSSYGYIYNWKAVMGSASSSSDNPSGVQGICPTGWHLPSDAEWTQLTTYVSGKADYVCESDTAAIAKALAFTTGWTNNTKTCTVGNDPTTNNATGFSALSTGYYNGSYN